MRAKEKHKIVVVAGIPPDNSGTGRMMRRLMSKTKNMDVDIRFVHKVRPSQPLRVLIKSRDWKKVAKVGWPYVLGQVWFYLQIMQLIAVRPGKLLLMHPQTIGFRLTIFLIKIWRRNFVYMYVLDNSYFCVRSYNFIPGQSAPCLGCHEGNFKQRDKMSCKAFPVRDENAGWYTQQLFLLGRDRRLKFLSQNDTQKSLLKKHFGSEASVDVVGLWGEDWTEPFNRWKGGQKAEVSHPNLIVFHSFFVPAKGAEWFVELARNCPELNFLCPFSKPVAVSDAPANLEFKNMTWETGLKEMAEQSWMIMVPSLWSAPIEGALIKSIVSAHRVGILHNETAFQNEVPGEIVLRLPVEPSAAASMLAESVRKKWAPDRDKVDQWLTEFQGRNQGFIGILIDRIENN